MQKLHAKSFIQKTLSLLMVVCFLMTALSGCYFLPEEEEILTPPLSEPEEVKYKTHTVEKGDIEYYIKGNGYFVSTSSETLQYGNVSGKIRDIFVKNGDTVEKGQLIAELETGDLSYTIKEQQINIKVAETNLKNAKITGNQNSIDLAQYNLELAKLRLQKSLDQQEAARLYSSIDGVVVYVAELEPGSTIGTYQTICRIADPSDLLINFSHNDIDKLVHGMEMTVKINGLDTTLSGVVVQVPADVPVSAPDSERNAVKIALDIPEELGTLADYGLELGDSVYVSILMDSRKDVIVLPTSYINKVSTRRYVKILNNGIPEERDIEIGLQSGNVVEVVSGLEVGETIVV